MADAESTLLFRRTSPELNRRELRSFARQLTLEVAGGRTFTCLLTGDRALQQLNRQFLSHDWPTDVLSFPSGSPVGELGELAISLDRAAAQAAEHGHDLDTELRILMLHGLLHLTGYDHEADRGQMRRVETRWRKHFGLPSGLIERTAARKSA